MFNANHLLKQFCINQESIKQWKRNIVTKNLIDSLSKIKTGTYHYLYNNETIWDKDENIITELLNKNNKVSKSLLSERNDDITFSIESGHNNPLKGTWYTYEQFPEILRLISIEFRILANHYESLLLPLLTDKDETFENHVNWLNKQSLIKDEVINKLKYIPEPFI